MEPYRGLSSHTQFDGKVVRWCDFTESVARTSLCQHCKPIDLKLISSLPAIPLHGRFVATLPLEQISDCSMCRLFFSSRVPVSDFEDQGHLVVPGVHQYHLRAYSALKMLRDFNYASLPASFKSKDCVFFAVVPNFVFQDITRRNPMQTTHFHTGLHRLSRIIVGKMATSVSPVLLETATIFSVDA
jgi:hypothetical protein